MNKTLKIVLGIIVVTLIVSGIVVYSKNKDSYINMNYPDATFTQLDAPKEGQEIAIIDTSIGEYRVALFREYAPNTVENFVDLANSGFYDGKYVYMVSDNYGIFMMGTTKKSGVIISEKEVIKEGEDDEKRIYSQEEYDTENAKYDNEVSENLWPFKGALISVGPNSKGTGTFIWTLDTFEYTDDVKEVLEGGENANMELVNKFYENGGLPQLSQQYTVFGQTYEGLDVVEKITQAEADSKSGNPNEDIMIKSIKIEKYKK